MHYIVRGVTKSQTQLSNFHFSLFTLLCGRDVYHFVFQVTNAFFFFIFLLMIPSRVSFISVIALFISVYLSFSSSRSLLNFSCLFSIHASILFLRSWIIFTVITLNSFSDRLLFPLHLVVLIGFLPFSFICNIYLCPLILSGLLSLWSPFHRL